MSVYGMPTKCLLCDKSALLAQLARSKSNSLTYWSSWSYLLRHVRPTCDGMPPCYVRLSGLSIQRTLPCNIPVGEELEVLASDRFLPRPASFLLLSPSAIRLMSRTHPRLCSQLRIAFVGNAVPDRFTELTKGCVDLCETCSFIAAMTLVGRDSTDVAYDALGYRPTCCGCEDLYATNPGGPRGQPLSELSLYVCR